MPIAIRTTDVNAPTRLKPNPVPDPDFASNPITSSPVAAYKSASTTASTDCVAAVVLGALLSLTDAVLQLQPTAKPPSAGAGAAAKGEEKDKEAKSPVSSSAASLHIVSKLMVGITGTSIFLVNTLNKFYSYPSSLPPAVSSSQYSLSASLSSTPFSLAASKATTWR